MPPRSKKQQRFMGAELGRLRAGRPTRTGMTESQLEDFARKPRKRLPERAPRRRPRRER